MSLTPEQIEERLDYITGSDAAVILGLSPYTSPVELWQYKTRMAVPKDISDNPSIKAGKKLEPVIREWFAEETGKSVVQAPDLIIHKSYNWMAGNIDGKIEGESAIFEAKTASIRMSHEWGPVGDNTIPDYYYCQVAHYVAICDVERAYIAVLIGGNDFRHHYVYERNLQFEDALIEKEKYFFEHYIKGEKCPEPKSADDIITIYGNKSEDKSIVADFNIQSDIEELQEIDIRIQEAQDHYKKVKDRICVYMGTNDKLLTQGDGKPAVSWKQSADRKYFNQERLEKEHKDIYAKFTEKRPGSRIFRPIKQQSK